MIPRAPLLFFMLYFFEGAPIGLVWWALPTLMASEGVSLSVIASLTALAALPWTFKFLLGPLVDRFLFTVRGHALTIAGFQMVLIFALVSLFFTPIGNPTFFWIILLVSAISATQDVVIDSWAIATVEDEQRGRVNGAMQAGLLAGRWLFGAGLLILLAYFQWQLAIGVLCFLLFLSAAYLVLKFGNVRDVISPTVSLAGWKTFRFAFTEKFPLLIIVAALSGFAFEAFGAVIGPFFIANGYDKQASGYVLSGTLVAMLAGSLFGGRITDLKGARPIFFLSGIILAILVSFIGFLHLSGNGAVLIFSTALTYFFIGIFTASSYAYYMRMAKGVMEATKFTFLMAMTNFCESLAAFTVGVVATRSSHSFSAAFLISAIISLVGLSVLWCGFSSKNDRVVRSAP